MTDCTNAKTMTPDEFAAAYAPPAQEQATEATQETPEDYFIRNRETGKLELHFSKETYAALDEDRKNAIKSNFLWGRKSGCWISRAKYPNLWHAERVAQSIGLVDAGKIGERPSFAEQMERKQERAEARADRYEARADRAAERGAALQKPMNAMRGDIAFFTQPNINSSAGRAFTRRREKIFAAFDRGMEAFRKSEYWQERAETARQTASGRGLNDRAFICRRISECESSLRKLKKIAERDETILKAIVEGKPVRKQFSEAYVTQEEAEKWLEDTLDRMEAEFDKLGFYQERLETLGGVEYSQENIRPGFVVKVQHWRACRVTSTGPKNFTFLILNSGGALTAAYAEIESIVEAKEAQLEKHPFKVGEVFTCHRWNSALRDTEKREYKIIRATDKSVTLQTGEEKPFIRKPSQITWDHSGKWRLCITDWNDGIVYKMSEE